MTKLHIMPGPAFCAAAAVSTKMPVPMRAPTPSRVSCNAPSWRTRPFFSAVSRILSSGLIRWNSIRSFPRFWSKGGTAWTGHKAPTLYAHDRPAQAPRVMAGDNGCPFSEAAGSASMDAATDPLLASALADYARRWPAEAVVAGHFLELLGDPLDPFLRERLAGHFTASCWLVDRAGERTLLTHHRKLGLWLQPGGHADGE